MSGMLKSGRFARRVVGLVGALASLLAMTGSAAAAIQPLQQVGASGTGAGKLDSPQTIAIGQDGSMYVGENLNDRISKFTPAGSFVKAWGWDVRPGGGTGFETCTTATRCKAGLPGGGAGQLHDPSGIAIDSAGNLHVSEFQNHRISEFTPSGSFIRARGFDVVPGGVTGLETCTAAPTGCKAGVAGGAAGQLAAPEDIVFDGAGNLWLANNGNNRIDEFSRSGAFVKGFGWDVIPGGLPGPEVCTSGTGCQFKLGGPEAGRLNSPRSVALKGGRVYVADEQNRRISEWTTAGTFVRSWGRNVDPGGGSGFETCTTTCQAGATPLSGSAGEVGFPEGLVFDGAGRLNVTELENQRVSQFTAVPSLVRAFGFNVIPGAPTGFEICTTSTGCQTGSAGAGFGELDQPVGIAVDCRGSVWVSDAGNDRVARYGEAGTPPCAAPPPPPSPPSNDFSFGKVKKNKRKGTAKLTVDIVEGPGDLELAKTKKVKADDEVAEAEGETAEKLAIKPKGKSKRKLRENGKAKVRAEVTYTPTGGESSTKATRIRLKKRL
jgi:tripartite motif-containing protein 71